jgi:hypothetical protein
MSAMPRSLSHHQRFNGGLFHTGPPATPDPDVVQAQLVARFVRDWKRRERRRLRLYRNGHKHL